MPCGGLLAFLLLRLAPAGRGGSCFGPGAPPCDDVARLYLLLFQRPDADVGHIRLSAGRTTYARAVKAASAITWAEPASGVAIGGCRLLAGASSWADRSLVRDGSFYPSRSLSAAQRLAYYASRLPLAEVATTYRFPPTPDVARRWVNTTPPGFTLDVRAWSLLSGAPTWPESLWADLQGYVRPSRRESTKLYRSRLPASVVEECWERFNHAVRPLAEAGRLGAVIVRFPSWFKPRLAAWEELACLPSRLEGFRVAVELTSERWYEGDACEQTLGLLEELGIGFVCTDSLRVKPVVAATADVAFVRFTGTPGHGRMGPGPGLDMVPEAAQTDTDPGGVGAPPPGGAWVGAPGGPNRHGPGRGWGPRLREEPGVGPQAAQTNTDRGGVGPRLREEPGVGAPGGPN